MFFRKNIAVFSLLFFLVFIFYSAVFLHPLNVLTPAPDIHGQYGVWKDIFLKLLSKDHAIPLWNPYEFSGNPFLANPLAGFFYFPNLIYFLIPTDNVFGFIFAFDSLLIGIFTYTFATLIMKGKTGPLLSAICFMLSGAIAARVNAGHVANVNVMVWFVGSILFTELYLQRMKNIYGVILSIVISLMIFAGHIQFAFYGMLTLSIYAFFRIFIDYKKGNSFMMLGIRGFKLLGFVIIGLGLCAVQLLPTIEFSQYSIRSGGLPYAFASTYSIPLFQLITFIFPNVFGSPAINAWWGRGSFWEFTAYVGFLPIIFAFYSFFKPNKYVVIFSVILLFSLLFSLGSYGVVFKFFFYFIPGFNMFRIPATFLYVSSFAISILAGFGLSNFLKSLQTKPKHMFFRTEALLGFMNLLIAALVIFTLSNKLFFTNFYIKYLSKFAKGYQELFYQSFRNDVLFVFIILLAFVTITFLFNGRKSYGILKGSIIILVVIDLMLFGTRFIKTVNPIQKLETSRIDQYIQKKIIDNRVFDLSSESLAPLQKNLIPNVSGYSPTYLSSYRNYIWKVGNHLNIAYEPFFSLFDLQNTTLLQMLGVKFIISPDKLPIASLNLIMQEKGKYLYELNNPKSNSYVIHNFIVVSDANKALAIVSDPEFDETKSLVLEQKPPVKFSGKGGFESTNSKIGTDEISANIKTTEDGFFVLREVWYPGWKAYVNGKEEKIYKANYLFRAIPIKSGVSKILIVYDPLTYRVGFLISSAFFFGVSIYLCRWLIKTRKRYNRNNR